MNKKEIADNLHKKGYNCAQSVAAAFSDELALNEKDLFKLTEGLGFGMGSGEGVCGALSSAIMVASYLSSSGNLDAPNSKKSTYKVANDLMEEFKAKAGSVICREIKGLNGAKPLCSCGECIDFGVELVLNYLKYR